MADIGADQWRLEQMCDLVDAYITDDNDEDDAIAFWKRILNDVETQQLYLKCLIYKYLSFSYGLGHQPLREAVSMIKKITTHAVSTTKLTTDVLKLKTENYRSASFSIENSPSRRRRLQSVAGRRKSTDPKVALAANRISVVPPEVMSGTVGKQKRKGSDTIAEDAMLSINNLNAYRDCEIASKLRELIYTMSFVINACQNDKWDYNSLREVYLTWNKARSWEQMTRPFEQTVMKRISRPPENLQPAEKWERMIDDVIQSCHAELESSHVITSGLDDQNVGNSIKYPTLRHKVRHNQTSTLAAIEAILTVLDKTYAKQEERKVMSLLQMFCETVVMASFVPPILMQQAYACILKLFLMPLPVSAAVREALDLVQVEMKSPGYFRRSIFYQEQEESYSNHGPNHYTTSASTNLFIDIGRDSWKTLTAALGNLTRKSGAAARNMDGIARQRLILEHIFQSVFGCADCDLELLHRLLEKCPDSKLSFICDEALSVMEQSVSIENPTYAIEFVRQQLEALSDNLESEEQSEGVNDDAVAGEMNKESDKSSRSNGKLNISPTHLSSTPPVPPINQSCLSRSLSAEASDSRISRASSEARDQLKDVTAVDRMDYAQIILRGFDKDQLSDAIFDLVRMTTKELVVEKRRSSGSYNAAHRRYVGKRRTNQLRDDDVRDSGLIEDYAENDEKPGEESTRSSASLQADDYWKGFAEAKSEEQVVCLDEDSKIKPPLSPTSISKRESKIKRSKSSVSDYKFANLSVKPPTESNSTPFTSTDKPSSSRSKKAKHRFRTLGRKGIKMMKTLRRASSNRALDSEACNDDDVTSNQVPSNEGNNFDVSTANDIILATKSSSASSLQTSSGNGFFETISVPRWRTTSLPVKNSLRKNYKGRRGNVLQLFPNTGDVHSQDANKTTEEDKKLLRTSTPICTDGMVSSVERSLSCDFLQTEDVERTENTAAKILRSKSNENIFYDETNIFQLNDDDDPSRNRMDSGITVDKSSDDASLTSPGHTRLPVWEETGVAGVKFARKQALKRNRKSMRSSSLTQQIQARMTKKKVLKLAFVGSDRTVADVARAYYELRRRQAARAPLLKHIDLRLYYIPVGSNAFADECLATNMTSTFDLRIGKMLGTIDSWYNSVIAMPANMLPRVRPTLSDEDVAVHVETSSSSVDGNHFEVLPRPDNILASSILSYFRFAIKTSNVPIFKAVMRTSTDEIIEEVFCCRAEIGHVAYRQAVQAGRFGKLGKLVDVNSDSGPPPVYTKLQYKKYGINGSRLPNKSLDEAHYYSATFVPIALSGNCRDQARFVGPDGLQVTLQDNDKRVKVIKRGTKVTAEEEEMTYKKVRASEAKMEVSRPVQGTFTISLDDTLIHTNIKSFTVSRCLAPEYDRPHTRQRKQALAAHHVMSLPLKTFWPNLILA